MKMSNISHIPLRISRIEFKQPQEESTNDSPWILEITFLYIHYADNSQALTRSLLVSDKHEEFYLWRVAIK